MQEACVANGAPSFLSLPGEIRNKIYYSYVFDPTGWMCAWFVTGNEFSLLLVCKQTFSEALSLHRSLFANLKAKIGDAQVFVVDLRQPRCIPSRLLVGVRSLCLELPLSEDAVFSYVRRQIEKLPCLQKVTFRKPCNVRAGCGTPIVVCRQSIERPAVMAKLELLVLSHLTRCISRSLAVWSLSVKSRMQVKVSAGSQFWLAGPPNEEIISVMHMEGGFDLGVDLEPPDTSKSLHFKCFSTTWPSLSVFDYDTLRPLALAEGMYGVDWVGQDDRKPRSGLRGTTLDLKLLEATFCDRSSG